MKWARIIHSITRPLIFRKKISPKIKKRLQIFLTRVVRGIRSCNLKRFYGAQNFELEMDLRIEQTVIRTEMNILFLAFEGEMKNE
jgi:hypothetical protein